MNEYRKDMCLEEIGLHAQNTIFILGSTINIIERDLYEHLNLLAGPLGPTWSRLSLKPRSNVNIRPIQ
jgi:hypothetical protein